MRLLMFFVDMVVVAVILATFMLMLSAIIDLITSYIIPNI